MPREIFFLDELPRNATGKVLKKDLKEYDDEGQPPEDSRLPRSELSAATGTMSGMTQQPLSIGDKAPDFTLRDQHGQDVTLSSWAGQKAVMLVFYPFAFSGTCSRELTGLRDRLGDFETDESTLVAVSCDPLHAQRALADRDGIFFPLLSDFWPHGAVTSAYGVLDENSGGARRSSYLIDKSGVVRWSVHNPVARVATSTSTPTR